MVKKYLLISFFILCRLIPPLAALELAGTCWSVLTEGEDSTALLAVRFLEKGECRIHHAYLRRGDDLPYERESTLESWYLARKDLIIIQDRWREFVPLRIENGPILSTRIGSEEIRLSPTSEEEWDRLAARFSLEEGLGQ